MTAQFTLIQESESVSLLYTCDWESWDWRDILVYQCSHWARALCLLGF